MKLRWVGVHVCVCVCVCAQNEHTSKPYAPKHTHGTQANTHRHTPTAYRGFQKTYMTKFHQQKNGTHTLTHTVEGSRKRTWQSFISKNMAEMSASWIS